MSTEQPVSKAGGDESPALPPDFQTPRDGLASGSLSGVALAAVGSLLAWCLLLAFHPIFVPPNKLIVAEPSLAQEAELKAASETATLYNAIVVLGWSGALIAGAMAAGEGWARRSWKTAAWGGLGCALAGAVFGGLAGWIGHSVYQYARPPGEMMIDLEGTVVVQMTMLGALGGGIGLSLGSLTGHAGTTFTRLLGGVLAGVFAGMLYPVGAAYLMPTVQTEHIVPYGGANSLLWLGLTGALLGLIVPGMKMRRTRTAPASPEPVTESAETEETHPLGAEQ